MASPARQTYLSARVTLGRALIELGQLDDGRRELETVLKSAPENLAAIRGVAEICHKQGSLGEALRHYKAALAIARNDPELEQTVEELSRQVAPQPRSAPDNSLSLDDMRHELKSLVTPQAAAAAAVPGEPSPPVAPPALFEAPAPVAPAALFEPPAPVNVPAPPESAATSEAAAFFASLEPFASSAPAPVAPPAAAAPRLASPLPAAAVPSAKPVDPALARAHETIAALEQWLDAIHGSRAH